MTLTNSFGKRLRRAALYSLLALASSGLQASSSRAEGIDDSGVCCPPTDRIFTASTQPAHPSSELCGWIEGLSESAKADAAPKPTRQVPPLPQFLSIDFDQELNIDTCNYGQWLADNLDASDATLAMSVANKPSSIPATLLSDDADPSESVCVSTGIDTAVRPPIASSGVSSRTSSDFNSALATMAAAATAGNRIPFGHWTEPFAMIGPGGEHSPGQIAQFQNWYRAGKRMVETLQPSEPVAKATAQFVPLVDFEGELPAVLSPSVIADLVAIKTAGTGASVLKTESLDSSLEFDADDPPVPSETEPVVTVQPQPDVAAPVEVVFDRSSLIGSSPVIASVKEAYLPYDLADRDRPSGQKTERPTDQKPDGVTVDDSPETSLVWTDGLLVPSRSPFCIHLDRPLTERGWSPLHSEFTPATSSVALPEAASPEIASENASVTALDSLGSPAGENKRDQTPKIASVRTPFLAGSADCILDEWIWKVGSVMEDAELADHWLKPKRIGQDVASLVVSGDRLASRIAYQLALVWPAKQRPAKPAPGIGARLLARAEAVERPVAELLPAQELPTPEQEVQLAQARAMLLQWVDVAHEVIDDWNQHLKDVPAVARHSGTQVESIRR